MEFKFERTLIKLTMYDGELVEFYKPTTKQAESLEKKIAKITDEYKDNLSKQLSALSDLTIDFLDEIGLPRDKAIQLEPAHLKDVVDYLIYEKKN